MSNIPGISIEVINSLVSIQGPPANAIAVIGHVGSTLPGTVTPFDTNVDGDVLTYTSLTDALDGLGGRCDGTGWVAGVKDTGTGATAPYDASDNLLRALDLIYLGNSSAKTYVCVLDGVADPLTGTAALPAGAQEALDLLLEFQDVGYVVLACLDPLAAGKSHAEAAASQNNPYNSPRYYVTGIDLFSVWDATNNSGAAKPLVAGDLAKWSTIKSTVGLVLSYVGNHQYNFSRVVDSTTLTDVDVEIGGQLVAAWLAGVLSAQSANFAITNYPAFSVSRYDGSNYIFKTTSEVDAATGEGWIITRFKNNSYVINKGVNFTDAASWELYPHRQITNTIHKVVAINLDQFIGVPKTTGLFIGAQQVLTGILNDAEAGRLINNAAGNVKDHPTQSDALAVDLSFETVKPANDIYVTMTVS